MKNEKIKQTSLCVMLGLFSYKQKYEKIEKEMAITEKTKKIKL